MANANDEIPSDSDALAMLARMASGAASNATQNGRAADGAEYDQMSARFRDAANRLR